VADPAAALAAYAKAVAGGVDSDGAPLIGYAMPWLAALLARKVPSETGRAPAARPAGTGGRDDPWVLSVGASGTELLAWVDPPPPPVPVDPDTATSGGALLAALRRAEPETAGLLAGRDEGAAGAALDDLEAWIAGGDGLVPYDSQ